MTPSTRGSSRSTASRSVGSDSDVSKISIVKPPATAARSAPRIMPKNTGFAMSATMIASMPVPRSDTRSLQLSGAVPELLGDLAYVFGGLELTRPGLDNARDTVDGATPATRATS